ncbi:MAG: hypothetical protein P8R43_06170, partial [Planctomycetota bacterium]|nr:hypothetical protein [Planctomycetota bacterium]
QAATWRAGCGMGHKLGFPEARGLAATERHDLEACRFALDPAVREGWPKASCVSISHYLQEEEPLTPQGDQRLIGSAHPTKAGDAVLGAAPVSP